MMLDKYDATEMVPGQMPPRCHTNRTLTNRICTQDTYPLGKYAPENYSLDTLWTDKVHKNIVLCKIYIGMSREMKLSYNTNHVFEGRGYYQGQIQNFGKGGGGSG